LLQRFISWWDKIVQEALQHFKHIGAAKNESAANQYKYMPNPNKSQHIPSAAAKSLKKSKSVCIMIERSLHIVPHKNICSNQSKYLQQTLLQHLTNVLVAKCSRV
jgi:hypothetical protein